MLPVSKTDVSDWMKSFMNSCISSVNEPFAREFLLPNYRFDPGHQVLFKRTVTIFTVLGVAPSCAQHSVSILDLYKQNAGRKLKTGLIVICSLRMR